MDVVVITSKDKFHSEIPDIIQLFNEGLTTLHLRKTRYSTKKLREFIEAIPKKYHNRIIIHSHHRLIFKYALKGVHISKQHRKKSMSLWFKLLYYRMRKPGLTITRTFHSIESFTDNRIKYSYVFIHPVFSKINPVKNSFDVSESYLQKLIRNYPCGVYASGNITDENIGLLKNYPFSGIGLSRYLWKSEGKKTEVFSRIKKEFSES